MQGTIPKLTDGMTVCENYAAREANHFYTDELFIRNSTDYLEWVVTQPGGVMNEEQIENLKAMLQSNDPESVELAKQIIKVKIDGT